MGPYIMPEMEPLQSHGEKIGSYHMGESSELGFRSTVRDGDATALTEEAFHRSLEARSPSIAQQYYLWLLENVSHGQAIDILLPSSISRNAMDDHYFVYPMFTFRTLGPGWLGMGALFLEARGAFPGPPSLQHRRGTSHALQRHGRDAGKVRAG